MIKNRTECEDCGLKENKYVPWQHPLAVEHKLLAIGQAPGGTEALTKVPFTGAAGKMLWRLMNEAGVDKQRIYISNICSCVPPGDRTPTDKEISCCSGRLIKEIKACQPNLIIALGEVAVKALTGRTGVQSQRGQFFPLLSRWDYEAPVLCALHPSFVMRQRQWIETAVKDIEKIKTFFKTGKTTVDRVDPTFVVDPDPSELAEILQKMSKKVTAFDIETPGQLDVLVADIIGIAFAASDDYAVALNFTPGVHTEQWDVMKRFLEDPTTRLCAQNGQFDIAVLETNGVYTKNLAFDTLLAEHTMNSDLPGNLDALRARYTDIAPYKPTKKDMKTIGSWSPERRAEYNCWDVITTHAVQRSQEARMTPAQIKVLKDIEIPLVDVCNYMERKGMNVSQRTLGLLANQMIPEVKRLEKEFFEPLQLNPRSPLQIKKYFGIDSTGVDALNGFIRRGHAQKDLMQAILDYRTFDKALKTYIIGVWNRRKEGRIHAHPKIAGTGTGRLSYSNPNLQNVPAELRIMYIPDSPEYSLVDADYSQLELRVLGLIAPEPIMLEEFSRGIRTHDAMGLLVYKKEWSELTPQEKVRAKAVVFGTAYGRSARSIAIEHGVKIKEAERWQNICIQKYPGIGAYLKTQADSFYSTHRCSTPFGRIRFLQTVLQSYNTPIQSSASDVMLTSLIELFRKGFDLRITVHDSVIIHVEDKILPDAVREMKKIMERPIPQLDNYCFPTKAEAGKDWFNLKEV